MKTCALSLLALSSLCATTVHATHPSGGTMWFTGQVYQRASAPIDFQSSQSEAPVAMRQVDSLLAFRQTKPREILDYFATYAAKNAEVVSVTYL